jgi:predicted flap endonuclease-1-like 5' DNA nuclease
MTTHEPNGSAQTEFPRSIGRVADRELALHGHTRYDHLAAVTEKQLLKIHGVGPKAVAILREELTGRGLSFASATTR